MRVTLLAIPASHACAAAAAMLEAKRVDYRRRDLFPALSKLWLQVLGFRGGTVPALRLDRRRVQGTRAIARALDAEWPEPPLFPADAAARARVEEIEAWADGELQQTARRIILRALLCSRAGTRAALEGARLPFGLPAALAAPLAPPLLWLDARLNGATDAAVRRDLAGLPALVAKLDGWIATGELGRRPPTAADYQVAASVRMLLTVADLEPVLAGSAVAELARRLVPEFPGELPAGVLPAPIERRASTGP